MSVVLKDALAGYPHVTALKDGSVRAEGIGFAWETVNPITRAFRRMVQNNCFSRGAEWWKFLA